MNKTAIKEEEWDLEISSSSKLLDLKLKEVWRYRDLLELFVRRDIVAVYKQTILGPIWFLIQPLLTTIVFTIVFGNIANISTGDLPHILFYLSGITVWNYFAETFATTSKTFTENANIFGKAYFPRLIMPLSKIISGLIKFFIQLGLLLIVYVYFILMEDFDLQPTIYLLLVPYLVLLMAGLGLGFGLIISSITTKYRDFSFLITFGIQLLMYAAPVIYPLSSLDKYKTLISANPMTAIIETFRFALFGKGGEFNLSLLLYSSVFTGVIVFIGMIFFNKIEKSFVDTV